MATHSSILAGKSHGCRSLEGYNPWGHKESDTTERLHFKCQPYTVKLPGLMLKFKIGSDLLLKHQTFFFQETSNIVLNT